MTIPLDESLECYPIVPLLERSAFTPLSPNVVAIWRVDLSQSSPVEETFLSEDELERANRFRFQKDRAHFITARASLRRVLAKYLHAAPGELSFEYGLHGKPRLLAAHSTDIRFNLSHSHGQALIAVALAREVGVDIEYLQRDVANLRIARRFFSDKEANFIADLPNADRAVAFLRCWTQKEAYLKARGEGIYYGLQHFSVTLSPNDPPALLENTLHPDEVDRWTFRVIDVGTDHVGCVAAEGRDWLMVCQHLERLK